MFLYLVYNQPLAAGLHPFAVLHMLQAFSAVLGKC